MANKGTNASVHALIPGDKLEIEGVVRPLCDDLGRDGICVEDTITPSEPTYIAIGSDEAAGCSTVYDWLDSTLAHTYSYGTLWTTDVTVRITVEVLAVRERLTE